MMFGFETEKKKNSAVDISQSVAFEHALTLT